MTTAFNFNALIKSEIIKFMRSCQSVFVAPGIIAHEFSQLYMAPRSTSARPERNVGTAV